VGVLKSKGLISSFTLGYAIQMFYIQMCDALTDTNFKAHSAVFVAAVPRLGEQILDLNGKIHEVTGVAYVADKYFTAAKDGMPPSPQIRVQVKQLSK
jgi:hypothetical protein